MPSTTDRLKLAIRLKKMRISAGSNKLLMKSAGLLSKASYLMQKCVSYAADGAC
ncbi:hypothetical protein SRABI133_04967 [Peribacillus simplex]|uniref:Uncharacterized protein n=1 Tax=Peribacillus simplex TaxID=1478 RepID=A0A9W4L8F2_9BACI|nr:hypothetical protein SRABI133_04967 [Peribacillus simplex]